jgi:hypothetical protein
MKVQLNKCYYLPNKRFELYFHIPLAILFLPRFKIIGHGNPDNNLESHFIIPKTESILYPNSAAKLSVWKQIPQNGCPVGNSNAIPL